MRHFLEKDMLNYILNKNDESEIPRKIESTGIKNRSVALNTKLVYVMCFTDD